MQSILKDYVHDVYNTHTYTHTQKQQQEQLHARIKLYVLYVKGQECESVCESRLRSGGCRGVWCVRGYLQCKLSCTL